MCKCDKICILESVTEYISYFNKQIVISSAEQYDDDDKIPHFTSKNTRVNQKSTLVKQDLKTNCSKCDIVKQNIELFISAEKIRKINNNFYEVHTNREIYLDSEINKNIKM